MRASRNSTKDKWADPDDAPEVTATDLQRGTWRNGNKRVTPAQGRAALRQALQKKQVNMLLDVSVIEHFKAKAGGRGYQTLINQTLREAMNREALERTLRRVVREEIRRGARVA
jgi:uncharacterized protein (DUF4415 family)